jgi:hypothetical protein
MLGKHQAMELAEKYADKIPRFAAYFSNQCLPNIKNYLWKPATEQFSTLNWTSFLGPRCQSIVSLTMQTSSHVFILKLHYLV